MSTAPPPDPPPPAPAPLSAGPGRLSETLATAALGLGLLVALATVWNLGPLLVLQGEAPLASPALRGLLMAVLVAAVAGPRLLVLWRRRQAAASGAARHGDEDLRAEVDAVFDAALHTLAGAAAGPAPLRPGDGAVAQAAAQATRVAAGWIARLRAGLQPAPDRLQARRWLLLLPTPGADRARSLAALQLADTQARLRLAPAAGGVLVMAGPQLQDSMAAWLQLLWRLKQARPLQPVSAVQVLVSAAELAGTGADPATLGDQLRGRLATAAGLFGLQPPVQLAVTGCERLDQWPTERARRRLHDALRRLDLGPPPEAVLLLGREPDDWAALGTALQQQLTPPPDPAAIDEAGLRRRQRQVRGSWGLAGLAVVLAAAALGLGWQQRQQRTAAVEFRLAVAQLSAERARGDQLDSALATALNDMQALDWEAAGSGSDNDTGTLGVLAALWPDATLTAAVQRAHDRALLHGLGRRLMLSLVDRVGQPMPPPARYELLHWLVALDAAAPAQWQGLAATLKHWPAHHPLSDLGDAVGLAVGVSRSGGGGGALGSLLAVAQPLPMLPRASTQPAIAGARAALTALPVAELLHDVLTQRAAGQDRPRLSAVDGRLLAWTNTDLAPLPPVFDTANFDNLVLEPLRLHLIDEARSTLALPVTAAPTVDSVLAVHVQRYVAHWQAVAGGIGLAPLTDATARRLAAARLGAAADNPLRTLLQDISSLVPLDTALRKERFDTLAVQAEQALQPMLAPLVALQTGSPSALDALLADIAATADLAGADPARLARLRQQQPTLPPPLRRVVGDWLGLPAAGPALSNTEPGDPRGESPARAAPAALDALQRMCRLAMNRYPLAAGATAELSREDFIWLFAPGRGFDAYVQTWLADQLDTSTVPWRWRPGSSEQTVGRQPGLQPASFESAARIRSMFFRSGPEPELALSVAQAGGATGGTTLLLDLGDRRLELPPRGALQPLVWPADAGQRVLLQPAGGGTGFAATGPWALLRWLDAMTLTPTRTPGGWRATMSPGGSPMELTLNFASAVPDKASLRGLRCPLDATSPTAAQPAAGKRKAAKA